MYKADYRNFLITNKLWLFYGALHYLGIFWIHAYASQMLRQLTEQISAHYPSSKIRNTHLRLFRPDRRPHTVIPPLTFKLDEFYKV